MIANLGQRPSGLRRGVRSVLAVGGGILATLVLTQVGMKFQDGIAQLVVVLLMALPAFALAWIDSPALVSYVTGIWAFAPGLRRFFDYQIGSYQPISLVSVTPLLVSLSLGIALFRARVYIPAKLRNGLMAVGVVFTLALAMGVAKHGSAAILEFLNYVLPFSLVLYLGARRPPPEYCDQILRSFVGVAVLVSAYGWFQYLVMDPWDKLWMLHGAGMSSIGAPEPMKVRVFSTLNSPGSLSGFLAPAMAVAYLDKRWRGIGGWLSVLLISSCQLLTLARSEWVAVIVMVVTFGLCAASKARARNIISLMVACAVFAIVIPMLPGGSKIAARFSSFGHISTDGSFKDRTQFSGEMFLHTFKYPFGMGFGAIGSSSKLGGNNELADSADFDNGFLALTYTFGQIGGIVIVVFLGSLTVYAFKRARMPGDTRFARLAFASGMAAITCLTFGDILEGVFGYCLWLPIGLWIATDSKVEEHRVLSDMTRLAAT